MKSLPPHSSKHHFSPPSPLEPFINENSGSRNLVETVLETKVSCIWLCVCVSVREKSERKRFSRHLFCYCFVHSYGDDDNPTQTAATAVQPSDTVEEVQPAGMERLTVSNVLRVCLNVLFWCILVRKFVKNSSSV